MLCISDHEKYDDLPMAAALGTAGRPSGILPFCCGSLCKYAAVAVGAATAFIQHPVKGFPRLKVTSHCCYCRSSYRLPPLLLCPLLANHCIQSVSLLL